MQPWTAPALCPILPAADRSPPPPYPPPPPRPQAGPSQSPVACERCRLKKTKCNRHQPVCGRCNAFEVDCEYDVGLTDRSRKAALKRRLTEAETERDSLRDLRDLLNFIQTQPDAEAHEIFRRLRANRDPISILQSIRQARLLLPSTSHTAHYDTDPQLELLDARGSRWSPLKLRARPWTNVAGDGVVSALISSFFAWDNIYFIPFVDRHCFVRDMNMRDGSQPQFCSPFLVNAICTLQHYCDAVTQVNAITGQTLQDLFSLEARRHYCLENAHASLPTVQGLLIMFAASAFLDCDDTLSDYRSLAYRMLDSLHVEEKIAASQNQDEKRAYSKAVWGVYCFENIIASLHNRRCERPTLTVPRLLSSIGASAVDNVDVFGDPFTVSSYRPPFTPGLLNAACDLAVIQNEVANYNFDVPELGTEDSLEIRRQQYQRLQAWQDGLPPHLRTEHNSTPGTGFLRIHADVVALLLLRPLNPRLAFHNHATPLDLCITHSQRIVFLIELHFRTYPIESSTLYLSSLFQVCLALIPSLPALLSAELFARAAAILHRSVADRRILRSIAAVVWGLKKNIPECARASFEHLGARKRTGGGGGGERRVDWDWGWPLREYLQSEPGMPHRDLERVEGRLGKLVALWEEAQED